MDLATNSIFVSRDVIFYEHIFPFASGSSSSIENLHDSFSVDSTSLVLPLSVPDSCVSDSTFLNESPTTLTDSADNVSADQISFSPLP